MKSLVTKSDRRKDAPTSLFYLRCLYHLFNSPKFVYKHCGFGYHVAPFYFRSCTDRNPKKGSAKKFTMLEGCPDTCVITAIKNYTSILEKVTVSQ